MLPPAPTNNAESPQPAFGLEPVSVPIPDSILKPPRMAERAETGSGPLLVMDPALTGHYYLG